MSLYSKKTPFNSGNLSNFQTSDAHPSQQWRAWIGSKLHRDPPRFSYRIHLANGYGTSLALEEQAALPLTGDVRELSALRGIARLLEWLTVEAVGGADVECVIITSPAVADLLRGTSELSSAGTFVEQVRTAFIESRAKLRIEPQPAISMLPVIGDEPQHKRAAAA